MLNRGPNNGENYVINYIVRVVLLTTKFIQKLTSAGHYFKHLMGMHSFESSGDGTTGHCYVPLSDEEIGTQVIGFLGIQCEELKQAGKVKA